MTGLGLTMLLLAAVPLAGLLAYALYVWYLARQRRATAVQAAQAQPAAAGAAAPAAAAAGAPANPPRWGQRLLGRARELSTFAAKAFVVLVILSFCYGLASMIAGSKSDATTAEEPTALPAEPTALPAIEIRGPFTPGPSDWSKRGVIRWWEVIMPGNAPGWQPVATEQAIPIAEPWRKFVIRYQSGRIETPHSSWPPQTYGWPRPTAEQLLARIPGTTARDLVLPDRWYGELCVRIVNTDGSSRGANYLWNAECAPHNSSVSAGSRAGYFQFAINVPQRIEWEFGKPLKDHAPPDGLVIAPGADVDRAYQEAAAALLRGNILLEATPRVDDTSVVSRNRGFVVFEVVELKEFLPPGSYYPAPPE